MELPDDWELLQFSRQHREGRIAFADRYQFRFEFSWRVVGGRPDMQHLLGDYLAKLKLESPDDDARSRNSGPWHGLRSGTGADESTRFSRYFPSESCLVEMVAFWPDGLDAGLERKILDSIAEERQTAPDLKRWRAFGMDLLVSDGMKLDQCKVDPAYAQMTFAPASNSRQVERFERLGMVPVWMKTGVRTWLAKRLPPSVTIESETSATVAGHGVETLRGTSYASGLARLLGRKHNHEVSAWLCPNDGRLYFAERSGPDAPREKESGGLAGGRLACCGDLRLGT
jgi:hypothetical protein